MPYQCILDNKVLIPEFFDREPPDFDNKREVTLLPFHREMTPKPTSLPPYHDHSFGLPQERGILGSHIKKRLHHRYRLYCVWKDRNR